MAKKSSIIVPILILVFSLIPAAVSTQPPVVTDTLYVGYPSWGPRHADPVRAYDTASGELIFNTYDTLIVMGEPVVNAWQLNPPGWDVHEQYWKFSPSLSSNVPDRVTISKSVTSGDVVVADPTGSTWSDGSTCVGWVDNNPGGTLGLTDDMYMKEPDGSFRTWIVSAFSAGPPVSVTLERFSYTFHMRTSPVINFSDSTGAVVDTFDVADAQYSLQRGLVQDQYGSPMWMFYKPLFDQQNSDSWANSTNLANLINNAIEVSGNDLTLNLGIPFPDVTFKQVMAQTWGSVISKEWAIGKGCWNGNLFEDLNADGIPDWYVTWRHISLSPIQSINPTNYAGTGPYRVMTASAALNLVVLQRNPGYWRGWPATQRKSYLETVELRYVSDWAQRKSDFVAGNLDVISVPRANMGELLDSYRESLYPEIKTIKNLPSLTMDTVFFTFSINLDGYWGSSFIGSGHLPDGIPADFFNNTHVRKAFAYSINRTKYLEEEYSKEAVVPSTPLIHGLYPDYRSGVAGYDISFDMAEAELKNAVFGGQNVWETGFTFVIPYPYWYPSPKWAEMVRDFFAQLSTYDGRPPEWPDFNISVQPIYPYLDMFWPESNEIPIARFGWIADYADADDFLRPFMSSSGDFASFQNYTTANGWGARKDELISSAIKTRDGSERAAMYAELEQIYIDDVPGFPLAQPMGRRWQKYWVKGWYYNALYPSQYYYGMYKDQACWGDVTGSSVGVPEGVCGMRDVGYIAGHFGARAPENARVPPYDSKWAPGVYSAAGADVYGDRKVDMRDIGFECAHFGDTTEP